MVLYCRNAKHKYRSGLRKLVASQSVPPSKPLPLTHVTDCIRLKAILEDGYLDPRPCAVFGDSRLYAFYARPAYRGSKEGSLHNLNFAPICFIIDASAAGNWSPIEVFPFDTGALQEGILAHHVHKDLSPFDFALEPKIASAQRLVRAFFGSEKSYYAVNPSLPNSPTFSPTDAEIVAYDSLVRRAANGSEDERGTSVELQFKDGLPIAGKVLAIILPQDFLDDPHIKKTIKEKRIEPLPYPFIPEHSIREFVGVFYTLAGQFYARKKNRHGWQW